MELITEQLKIKTVAERWRDQYLDKSSRKWKPCKNTTGEFIYQKLLELPESVTVEDVVKIIGNNSWTVIRCHECKQEVKAAIWLGEALGWESNSALICLECLQKAIELL